MGALVSGSHALRLHCKRVRSRKEGRIPGANPPEFMVWNLLSSVVCVCVPDLEPVLTG